MSCERIETQNNVEQEVEEEEDEDTKQMKKDLEVSLIQCDNVHFSNRIIPEYPCITILKDIQYKPGDVIELELKGIQFNWTNPDLALLICSKRKISAFEKLENTTTLLFSSELIIPYEERNNHPFKVIVRTFQTNWHNHLPIETQNRIRSLKMFNLEYTFIPKKYVQNKKMEMERVQVHLYNPNDKEVLEYLETEPNYKLENYWHDWEN